MPERNHELIIDGYVYPDTITVTLSNGDFVGSRDYVSKELCDSINDANAAWQAENAKLRSIITDMWPFAKVGMDDYCVMRQCPLFEDCKTLVGNSCGIEDAITKRLAGLGIEAG